MISPPFVRARLPTVCRYLLLATLVFAGVAAATRGTYLAFNGEFGDGRMRAAEYVVFKSGLYPHFVIAGIAPPKPLRRVYTVYPPYALPLFTLFFEPGGVPQGAIMISGLSLAAIAYLGFASSSRYGNEAPQLRPWLMALPWTVTGISSALAMGQFSIICAALILLQIKWLEENKPLAAGLCWALAMIKPQIGILFAPLFLINRQLRGLATGSLLLLLLSALTCWWTATPPLKIIHQYLFKSELKNFTGNWVDGPGRLAKAIGLDIQTMTTCAIILFILLVILITRAIARNKNPPHLILLSGALALTGKILVYNRLYDTIMIWPALVSMLLLATRKKSLFAWIMAVLTILSALLPGRWMVALPWLNVPVAMIWIAGAGYLFRESFKKYPEPEWHDT